jgi:NAD(P)-dependent dehydrogenase (short-subunit alcohol dehydrogenase family)
MSSWKTSEAVPSQQGRTYLVTGANSGLGFETALALAQKDAEVILACRNQKRGDDAVARIAAAVPQAKLSLLPLDLASLASIREAAARLQDSHSSLTGLINNAGLMALPYTKTADGFEMQIGTNHLGHFALSSLLMPLLEKASGRLVNVSSIFHRQGKVVSDDLSFENRKYKKWDAYGQSKLANLLFTFELHRRLSAKSSSVQALAAHPGYSATELQNKGPRAEGSSVMEQLMEMSNQLFAQSSSIGALPQLRAATDPDAKGGEYYGPDGFFEARGGATLVNANAAAHDREVAAALWQKSIELTGESFAGL